jgi:hypothetical protein
MLDVVFSFGVHSANQKNVSLSVFVQWLLEAIVALVDRLPVFLKLLFVLVLSVSSSVELFSFVIWVSFWVSHVFSVGFISFLC